MMQRYIWNAAALVWGFAEATLFFIVPDVILSLIGLQRGVRPGALAAICAAAGAGLGGAVMFTWSAVAPSDVRDIVLALPAISVDMVEAARASMAEHGWLLATFAGPVTSTPYKVFAMLAPDAGAPMLLFALASVAARLPRFILAAAVASLARAWLGRRFSARTLTLLWAAGWIMFYAAFFASMPS
ncbi:hypothetical protein [Terricaulis sp.]|uniref:hypothetical protein n=1 Tax=Terricaulis sp. TaxID=2768686 RepID=UPI0037839671